MKMRTIATIGAAVMGLSLITAPAFARDGDHWRGENYGRHDGCNDRDGHRHHGRFDRDDWRRFSFRDERGWDRDGRGRGDHDGHRWHDRDHDGDRDGGREGGRDGGRDRHDWR